jgi:hypothetical protein
MPPALSGRISAVLKTFTGLPPLGGQQDFVAVVDRDVAHEAPIEAAEVRRDDFGAVESSDCSDRPEGGTDDCCSRMSHVIHHVTPLGRVIGVLSKYVALISSAPGVRC